MNKHKRRAGSTMVELVVTFALLAMYAAAIATVLGLSVQVYSSASGRATAQTVSQTLLDKICGELCGAQGGVKAEYTLTIMNRDAIPDSEAADYLPYDSYSCVAFCNRTGSPIYITTEDGLLLIHYRPVNDNSIKLKAVDWKFDRKMYQDYRITDLRFDILYHNGKRTNIICVTLTIRNEKNGFSYTAERYAECFNFENTEISKIDYQGIKKDGV